MPIVLARMEQRGICVDRAILSRLSGEFAQDMARLEADIQTLAGENFNPGSPKQLGDILFGKFGLPGAKKTATGAWSTSASVLDDLAEQGHELAARVLDWRQVQKLRSTYAEALPRFVNPTHRVGSIRPTPWRRRRPGGCRRPSPICKIFRCATRPGEKSAAPLSPAPAKS